MTDQGAILGYTFRGNENHYYEDVSSRGYFELKTKLLNKSNNYQTSYCKLITEDVYDKHRIQMKIPKVDLIDRIDLVISSTESLNNLISKISVSFDNKQFDRFSCSDIETQINTLASFYNKKIRIINDKTFVPLELFSLHENNILSPLCLVYTKIRIDIEIKKKVDVYLCGNVYALNNPERFLLRSSNSLENYGIQSQCQEFTLQKGTNTFKLHFVHVMYVLYFWGHDKTKIINIKLLFNGREFYDGEIEPLEYYKHSMGYTFEPSAFFFVKEKLTEFSKTAINFSKMEKIELVIETEQETASNFYVCGLNYQCMKMMNGMCGLLFPN